MPHPPLTEIGVGEHRGAAVRFEIPPEGLRDEAIGGYFRTLAHEGGVGCTSPATSRSGFAHPPREKPVVKTAAHRVR